MHKVAAVFFIMIGLVLFVGMVWHGTYTKTFIPESILIGGCGAIFFGFGFDWWKNP